MFGYAANNISLMRYCNMNVIKLSDIFFKFAQQITITPGKPEVEAAKDIVEKYSPGLLRSGTPVENIIVGPSANYGHVVSNEPGTIYLNADRIVNEAGSMNGRAAALACASTIIHEKAHLLDLADGLFPGGESPAEAAENQFKQWLESGGFQQIETIPSYQRLAE
jgi:hypothetical protein